MPADARQVNSVCAASIAHAQRWNPRQKQLPSMGGKGHLLCPVMTSNGHLVLSRCMPEKGMSQQPIFPTKQHGIQNQKR